MTSLTKKEHSLNQDLKSTCKADIKSATIRRKPNPQNSKHKPILLHHQAQHLLYLMFLSGALLFHPTLHINLDRRRLNNLSFTQFLLLLEQATCHLSLQDTQH